MRRLFPLLLLGVLSCSAGKSEDDLDAGPVGDFDLAERGGQAVTRDDLRGKVWIASFIFTHCTGPCPQVTTTMARLQTELKLADKDDLRLVTFTVDPSRDDPAKLKQYAESFQAHPERWLFLTGTQHAIHELILKSFKVAVAENPDRGKKPGDEFDHSTRLAVVDKRGHIRGYFEGLPVSHSEEDARAFEANLARLRKRVAGLLKEGGQ